MPRQTPLHARHLEMKARMVDFAGWEMPLHYGSQIEEHHAVRRDCGLFDVSHMRPLDIRGEEARPFLRRLLANDVAKLSTSGQALYSCMLHEGGGVIDDLIVYCITDTWFRLVLNASCAERDIAWIEAQRDVCAPGLTLSPRFDLAMLAVQGPKAQARLDAALPGVDGLTRSLRPFHSALVGEMLLARTGYTGEDGFEVMLPARAAPFLWQALVDAGARPCGLGARDTLRLEAGMNLYGQEMDERVTPFESGLGWTVAFSEGRDFIGREALLRLPRERQLIGLVLRGRGVPRAHQVVHTARGPGLVTSGGYSPTLDVGIALARVPIGPAPGDAVEVEMRNRRVEARVVRYPFVRNGEIRIQL